MTRYTRILLLLFPVLFCQLLTAQSLFKKGFLIVNSGDSLTGLIDYRGDYLMAKECRYKDTEKSEVQVFTPFDIQAFGFINSKFYISKDFEGERYFFEYLINGELDVLYLRESGEGAYFIEKDTIPLTKLDYQKGIRENEGKFYNYESTIHNGIINLFIQDAPQLSEEANNIGEPDHKNLIAFAQKYHQEVCETEDCIIYQKDKNKLKIEGEINLSCSDFRQESNYFIAYGFNQSTAIQTGIIIHIWMPRTSEKIFIRTGLSFANLGNEGEVRMIYKTPVMIEYLYPKYRIRPHFAYGLNFYSPFIYTSGFNTGFNLVISENIHFRMNYEMDFRNTTFFPLTPSEFFSSGVGGGLYIKF